MNEITVGKNNEGERLDRFLSTVVADSSRSDIQGRIKDGIVTVNGEQVKPNYKVKADDEIVVEERELVEADIEAENLNLDIIYEDSDS